MITTALLFFHMRYHYKKPEIYSNAYGERYACNHPLYSCCTLYRIQEKGLAVIQQRFDENRKATYWTDLDPWLIDEIYLNPGFKEFFDQRSDYARDTLYPTVTIRQIMWALKMKPLPKKRWETVFDRRLI